MRTILKKLLKTVPDSDEEESKDSSFSRRSRKSESDLMSDNPLFAITTANDRKWALNMHRSQPYKLGLYLLNLIYDDDELSTMSRSGTGKTAEKEIPPQVLRSIYGTKPLIL